MRSITVTEAEAGRRLDRYIMKHLPKAPKSLLYKSLRGNAFRLNGKRIHDREYVVRCKDVLEMYFTDDQLREMGFVQQEEPLLELGLWKVPIVYEDDHIAVFNKPVGLLSQKNDEKSVSLTEIGAEMLYQRGLSRTAGFRPGVCNRLDRNTSGAVIMGKNLMAAQAVSQLIREKRIDKYYYAVVSGCPQWTESRELIHYCKKDTKKNRLFVYSEPKTDTQKVHCRVSVIAMNREKRISLIRVQLLTGKSHQIRAQLAAEGFPLVGDPKYRTVRDFQEDRQRFGVCHQMLCAQELYFRETIPPLQGLTGKHIQVPLPEEMKNIVSDFFTMR